MHTTTCTYQIRTAIINHGWFLFLFFWRKQVIKTEFPLLIFFFWKRCLFMAGSSQCAGTVTISLLRQRKRARNSTETMFNSPISLFSLLILTSHKSIIARGDQLQQSHSFLALICSCGLKILHLKHKKVCKNNQNSLY